MATNEQVLLAVLARLDEDELKGPMSVDDYVKKVKRERTNAKLSCGARSRPLVEKTFHLLEEQRLGKHVEVDGELSFKFSDVGRERLKEAYEEYERLPGSSRPRRHTAVSSTRSREFARLGSFIKARLLSDHDEHASIDDGLSVLVNYPNTARPVTLTRGAPEPSPIDSSYSSATFASSCPQAVFQSQVSSCSEEDTTSDFSDSPSAPECDMPFPGMARTPHPVLIVHPNTRSHAKLDFVAGEIIQGDNDLTDAKRGRSRRSSAASVGSQGNILEELRLLNAKVEEMDRRIELRLRRVESRSNSSTSSEEALLTSPSHSNVPLQGSSRAHIHHTPSFSSTTGEEDEVEMVLDDAQLSEYWSIRNELRTALWTVDACQHSRGSGFRTPPPSLAPSISTPASSPSNSNASVRSSRSRGQGRGQRRKSKSSVVSAKSRSSNVGEAGTFLERLRDRCVAYFRRLAGQLNIRS